MPNFYIDYKIGGHHGITNPQVLLEDHRGVNKMSADSYGKYYEFVIY